MPRRKRDGPSVLIIDDDSDSREALAELLTDQGYVVSAAANGAEGLVYLRSGKHAHVILLDLMMPDVDGWDFRVEQKRDPALAAIPVVVISGAGKLLDAEYALRKPLDVQALLALLREILDAPS
jgi:CheY-like chemotaxis protein